MRMPLTCLLLFVLVPLVRAQTIDEALSHLNEERWAEAAAAFDALTAGEPENGRAWYFLGAARHRLAEYDAAVSAWERALELGFAPPNTHYNLAAAHARRGDADQAFARLRAAVEAGFANADYMQSDEDLAALRDTPAFAEVVAQARRNAEPCMHEPDRQAFDFWVGDWEVRNPGGSVVGTNRIAKRERGCVLVEEWTGAGGGSGMSMNFYDSALGRWVQIWMGATGSVIRLEGGLDAGGAMVLEGTMTTGTPGETQPLRGTWTLLDDGRVRQHFESYDAEADAWSTWFDGYYTRTDESP